VSTFVDWVDEAYTPHAILTAQVIAQPSSGTRR
jgi:hypothetical protein